MCSSPEPQGHVLLLSRQEQLGGDGGQHGRRRTGGRGWEGEEGTRGMRSTGRGGGGWEDGHGDTRVLRGLGSRCPW